MAEPTTPVDFDVGGALKAGYSENEIASYLGSQTGFDVDAARKAGYNSNEIIQHLAPPPPEPAPKVEPKPEPVSGTALGMAKAVGQTVAEAPAGLEVGVGAMMKSAGQAEGVQSRRDVDLMHRLDQGEDFGTLMKSAPNDLARLALTQYRRSSPEEKATMRQDAINAVAAPPGALERGGANVLKAGQDLAEDAKKLIPLTPEEESRPSVTIAKTAASLLTFLATAGPAGVPGMVAYGGIESYGKTYEEAKKAGASDEDATVAASISGVVQGGLNAVPAHKALAVADQIPKAFKGEFVKTLVEMAKSGGTLLGFTQVSNLADNYIAKETFDPSRPVTQGAGEHMGETFAAGALLPVIPAAAARAFRPRTPAEAAKPVMDAPTTDDAIAAAQRVVAEGTPVDPTEVQRMAEYGGAADQDQAKLLQLFGGLNRGEVIQADDGTYHYRTGDGEDAQTVPLKVWNPDAPRPEGDEPTISPKLAAAQRDVYGRLGVRVVYFEGDKNIPFDGAVDPQNPNTIFLSSDPTRQVSQVGAHEIGHTLEDTTMPDGTRLADIFHGLIRQNLTGEGWRRANELFGSTAPDRANFPNTAEGQSAHGDAVLNHLVTEIGAETMAELPKFQTFMPKVVDEVQARYGADVAKDVLAKLLDGVRTAMTRLREFYFRPEDHAEYGQPQVEAQKWLTNLDAIHDVGAKMYAVRFGEAAERENAGLAEMRDKTQRQRFLAQFEGAGSEVPPPSAPEGFAVQRPAEEAARPPAEAPETPTPEAPRPPGPMNDPAAYAEAASRASTLRRWLGDLDAERRSTAPASPQAALLKQTEAAILGKVNGVEARLTQTQAERLAAVRSQIDALHNPTEPSADMVKVRQALEVEQQRMADAASIGSRSSAGPGRAGGRPRAPRAAEAPGRIQAVMPDAATETVVPRETETAPVAEAPQPSSRETVTQPAEIPAVSAPEQPVSAFQTKVRAERERLWAEEMPGRQRGGGTTRQGLASASAANERMVTESARDKVMREEVGEDAIMDAIERGLTDDQIFAVARFYRPGEGKTPQESFREAVDRYAALEHEQALREEAAGLFDPNYDALKVSNPDLDGIERAYRHMEEANARERAANEAPFESSQDNGNGRANPPEVPERQDGAEAGGQSGRRSEVPGEERNQGPSASLTRDSSWAIKNKATGEILFETFDRAKVDALNTDKYVAVPILEHLQDYNRRVRENDGEEPAAKFSPRQREEQPNSAEYEAASRAHTEASKEFRAAQADYRARRTDDATFLKAKAKFAEATKVYDAAFEKEANKEPALVAAPEAPAEDLFSRQRQVDKERAQLSMKGNAKRGGQEAADDLPLFGGDRQKTLFSPRITGENKTRVYTPEEQKAFENVGRTTEPFSLRNWINETKDDLARRMVRGALDRYIGIKESDPVGYMALRIANSTAAAVSAFRDLGTLKFDGHAYNIKDRNGGVTNHLLKPLGDEAHDFIWWVAANRAERLKGEDRENLFGDTDIAALKKLNQGTIDHDYTLSNGTVTRSREAVYLDSLKKMDVFNKNVLDLAVDAGLLPRDKVDALWSNPFYVPFYRQAAEGDANFVGPNTNSSFVKKSAFKTLKGGSEKLNNDLWENAFGNWQHLIDASLRNRAVTHVLDVASAPGTGAARKLTTQEANHLSDKEMKAKTVWIMKDGEKVSYLVEDPMLFKAVTVLDPLSDPAGIMTAGRWFKKVLQIGVTANPMFAIRNLIRDTEQTLAVAPSGVNVVKNIATGFKMNDLPGALQNVARAVAARDLKETGITDEAASAIAGGGLMRLNSGTDSGVSKVNVKDVLNTPEAVDGFWNYVKTVAHAYREAMGQSEDVNRLALYKKLRDEGVPHDAASFAARDLADFTLSGASPVVRAISQLVPFLNARLQGLYKVGRAAGDADANVMAAVGAKVAVGMTKRIAYVMGAATVLSVALDQIYKDDEEYQKLTDYDRSTYYNFRFGKTWYHIPKGFEIAALSNIATDGIEAFFDKKMTAQRFFRDVWQNADSNLNMNPIPQGVRPIYDVATNTSGLGRHIEPMGMENLQPEQRYTGRTTLAARGLSSTMNAGLRAIPGSSLSFSSPIQIDYMANAYGGWLATTALGLADKVVRSFTSEPSRPAGDFWSDVTQGMVTTEPKAASRYTEMLYQQGTAIEQAYATYRNMISQGHAVEAAKFFADNKDELQKHGMVSGLMRLESSLNKQIRLVENNPTATPEQKKIQIQALNTAKNRAAQQGFEAR